MPTLIAERCIPQVYIMPTEQGAVGKTAWILYSNTHTKLPHSAYLCVLLISEHTTVCLATHTPTLHYAQATHTVGYRAHTTPGGATHTLHCVHLGTKCGYMHHQHQYLHQHGYCSTVGGVSHSVLILPARSIAIVSKQIFLWHVLPAIVFIGQLLSFFLSC